MAHLAQLAAPETYRACDWDLKTDNAGRAYWTDLFRWHADAVLVPLIREEYPNAPASGISAFRDEYRAKFDDIDARPDAYDRLDVLYFTELRREMLQRHKFPDPFIGVKQRENNAALDLLPAILLELDRVDPARRRELLTLGLMAGNIFDLGARATAHRQNNAEAFHTTRANQPARPWFADDVDAWWRRWDDGAAYQHAVFFVDNAGGDIILGCLPLIRWILQAGTRVTVAANTSPALNDITDAALPPLFAKCAVFDDVLGESLAADRLRTVASGSHAPLIDLTLLTEEFVDETRDADLIILHGMGRGVESNYDATFTTDVLRTAVIKDEGVAQHMGGKVFDCIFRFTCLA